MAVAVTVAVDLVAAPPPAAVVASVAMIAIATIAPIPPLLPPLMRSLIVPVASRRNVFGMATEMGIKTAMGEDVPVLTRAQAQVLALALAPARKICMRE